MREAQWVLAVDGGGSKTEAELLDASGRHLARARSGPCNLYRDPEAGLQSLMSAWAQCCRGAGLDPAAAAPRTILSAALAGSGAPPGRAHFYAATRHFARAALSSDAYAALLGAFAAGPGVLLSIGTGTIACRRDREGRFERIGGWGFPAGDRGGGAWIGLRLVTAWLEHRDGMRPGAPEDEPLWAAVEARAGSEREAILDWLRRAGPAEFGALVPAGLDSAGAGSPLARAILDEAAAHLATLAQGLLRPGLELALAGGLAPVFAPLLASRLPLPLSPRAADPLRGAWLVAEGAAPPEFTSTVQRTPA